MANVFLKSLMGNNVTLDDQEPDKDTEQGLFEKAGLGNTGHDMDRALINVGEGASLGALPYIAGKAAGAGELLKNSPGALKDMVTGNSASLAAREKAVQDATESARKDALARQYRASALPGATAEKMAGAMLVPSVIPGGGMAKGMLNGGLFGTATAIGEGLSKDQGAGEVGENAAKYGGMGTFLGGLLGKLGSSEENAIAGKTSSSLYDGAEEAAAVKPPEWKSKLDLNPGNNQRIGAEKIAAKRAEVEAAQKAILAAKAGPKPVSNAIIPPVPPEAAKEAATITRLKKTIGYEPEGVPKGIQGAVDLENVPVEDSWSSLFTKLPKLKDGALEQMGGRYSTPAMARQNFPDNMRDLKGATLPHKELEELANAPAQETLSGRSMLEKPGVFNKLGHTVNDNASRKMEAMGGALEDSLAGRQLNREVKAAVEHDDQMRRVVDGRMPLPRVFEGAGEGVEGGYPEFTHRPPDAPRPGNWRRLTDDEKP